jgi:hypothetical protein
LLNRHLRPVLGWRRFTFDAAGLAHRAQRQGTNSPRGAKIIAASRRSGGASREPPSHTAHSERAKAWACVSPSREGIDPSALPPRDLRDQMRGGPEAVQAELVRVVTRHA